MNPTGLIGEFKAFLVKTNALALGIAVVLGIAIADLVKALVGDFIQPIIDLVKTGDSGFTIWKFQIGHFIGAAINFVAVMAVIFLIAKMFIKEEKKA